MNLKEHTCCFFGHRKIIVTEELTNNLEIAIENLIKNENVDTFLFGSKSEFDRLCLAVTTKLKKKYSHIKRIYVRAEFPYVDENYKAYILKRYEDTYYPEKIHGSGRAAYVERNYEMVNNSCFCVVYYDENYMPPKRKNSRKDLADNQPGSGTKRAYEYALKKGVKIINMFEKLW